MGMFEGPTQHTQPLSPLSTLHCLLIILIATSIYSASTSMSDPDSDENSTRSSKRSRDRSEKSNSRKKRRKEKKSSKRRRKDYRRNKRHHRHHSESDNDSSVSSNSIDREEEYRKIRKRKHRKTQKRKEQKRKTTRDDSSGEDNGYRRLSRRGEKRDGKSFGSGDDDRPPTKIMKPEMLDVTSARCTIEVDHLKEDKSDVVKEPDQKNSIIKTESTVNRDSNDSNPKAKSMVPMTREEYEKQRNTIKEVFDPVSKRHRLVRGTGEIIERIVSKSEHEKINKIATRGDGMSFAHSIMNAATRRK